MSNRTLTVLRVLSTPDTAILTDPRSEVSMAWRSSRMTTSLSLPGSPTNASSTSRATAPVQLHELRRCPRRYCGHCVVEQSAKAERDRFESELTLPRARQVTQAVDDGDQSCRRGLHLVELHYLLIGESGASRPCRRHQDSVDRLGQLGTDAVDQSSQRGFEVTDFSVGSCHTLPRPSPVLRMSHQSAQSPPDSAVISVTHAPPCRAGSIVSSGYVADSSPSTSSTVDVVARCRIGIKSW